VRKQPGISDFPERVTCLFSVPHATTFPRSSSGNAVPHLHLTDQRQSSLAVYACRRGGCDRGGQLLGCTSISPTSSHCRPPDALWALWWPSPGASPRAAQASEPRPSGRLSCRGRDHRAVGSRETPRPAGHRGSVARGPYRTVDIATVDSSSMRTVEGTFAGRHAAYCYGARSNDKFVRPHELISAVRSLAALYFFGRISIPGRVSRSPSSGDGRLESTSDA
jgi:hypothetical protein